nr:putative D-aminoacid aminotransferase-like PLP-dependent enzymes superfamily protein [Tanacetum cinerariifolium]
MGKRKLSDYDDNESDDDICVNSRPSKISCYEKGCYSAENGGDYVNVESGTDDDHKGFFIKEESCGSCEKKGGNVNGELSENKGRYWDTWSERTHNNGSESLFYQRHLHRLATSARILFDSCLKLLFPPETNMTSASLQKVKYLNWESLIESLINETNMTSASLQKIKYLNWESLIESLINGSMRKPMPYALKERKSETELAFTALVSGTLGILVPDEKAGKEDVCRVFSMHIHVSLYIPLAFGVQKNGAHLAVVGHRRDVLNEKY